MSTTTNDLAFIKGLIKLEPKLKEKSEHNLFNTLDLVFKAVYGKRATRELVRQGLAESKKLKLKRNWNLKFRYCVSLFLTKPDLSIKLATKALKEKFNQKTRPSVIISAREEAFAMPTADITDFVGKVEHEFRSKASDSLNLIGGVYARTT